MRASGYPVASISESGLLPPGVTLKDNGDGTATLAGTPAWWDRAADYPIVITASNGVSPAAAQHFKLVLKYPVKIAVKVPADAVVGIPVPATAVLNSGDSHGTVSFSDSLNGGAAVPVPGCQDMPLFDDTARCLFTPASSAGPGACKVTASYSGDARYAGATGSASVAAQARTSLALTSSAARSAGSPLTMTAAVRPVPDAGTVTFQVTGPNGERVALPASCTAAPVGTGTVTCVFTPAARGVYHVSVAYSGDSLYLKSAASVTVKVA